MSSAEYPVWAFRIVLLLALACFGLLASVVFLALRPPPAAPNADATLHDPELRRAAILQLLRESPRINDSHADPQVGRINAPSLDGYRFGDIQVSTNRFGLRERDYEMPKPDGLVRIVILGDSMVFGWNVAAEDRMGVHLERWLSERAPRLAGRVECLHLGVPSWNILAESAYVRRQLSDLQPDLVVQIAVPNDLDDCAGPRGFGVMSRFTPQRRDRADSIIGVAWPKIAFGINRFNYLAFGLDHESRQRYREAREAIRQLSDAIESIGGRYRLLLHFGGGRLGVAWQHLGRHLDPDHVEYLSTAFRLDPAYLISERDHHWSRAGHAKVAQLIYGLLWRDDLLPGEGVPPWDEASRAVDEIAGRGRREAKRGPLPPPPIGAEVDLARLNPESARQIHGGIDREGRVSPYASILLKNRRGKRVRIEARAFDRPELESGRVDVLIDGERVGGFGLRAGVPLDLSYPLPSRVANRRYVTLGLRSSDYIYQDSDLQHCVSFSLQRVAIEGDERERRGRAGRDSCCGRRIGSAHPRRPRAGPRPCEECRRRSLSAARSPGASAGRSTRWCPGGEH